VRAVQQAAVLVLPSTTDAECAGTVLMEAMACATPVVASDVGSLAYVAEGCGLIVEPAQPDTLAAAIRRVLTEDGLAERLGAAGRERAEQNFSRPLMVERYRTLFRRLADR
jgi:glycosyltransferase involved in cell wall biosynthesis